MSHAFRYGLTLVILVVGTTSAFRFRNTDDSAGHSQFGSRPDRSARAAETDETIPPIAQTAPGDPFVTKLPGSSTPQSVVPVAGYLNQPNAIPRTGFASREREVENSDALAAEQKKSSINKHSAPPTREFREYAVRAGDSLSEIARRELGDPQRFREIYELNRDRLAGPNDLYSGMMLRLPLPMNMETTSNAGKSENLTRVPAFDLEFAPIEPDDGYTIVPARRSETATNTGSAEPQRDILPARGIIPARKAPFLPRAFRRNLDGPSAEFLQPHHAPH